MLVVDFRRCNGREPFAAYEDFGVRCVQRLPKRVLLRTGEEEPDIHYTLSDVLGTVAGAVGRSLGMKLAVVTTFRSVAQVAGAMQHKLLGLGCELRVFPSEGEAMLWLGGGAPLGLATAPLHAEECEAG